ncbi:diacylglycerol/lipid kinase family protein [Actinomadura rupiterrae]|uniref:diacylglycerol/lipid kinase family protein n=1 Tax=Actinomadura rupiterrae TaxID=559627 RepID=UPI0020A3FA1C|nr:YegS/Rv2252/BmrU family lipid kinase [Actinomadura rupiterrae]MCP2336372.1 YegS/Rv2252/BmrU family lipid kinase [Actinomadura rupiterrae]
MDSAIRSGSGRAVLIVNARSRRGRRLYGRARALLNAAGLEFAEIVPVTDPSGLRPLFRRVLADRPDLVVVGGGDGTIAEAVRHLTHQDAALGVLPLGTTNNFARSLELPMDLAGAVEVLRAGKVADVDVGWFEGTTDETGAGRADAGAGAGAGADADAGTDAGDEAGHVFANMVSLGLSVQVARHVPHELKRVLGRPAYALTAARLLPRHDAFHATIEIDGVTTEVETHQLNIANGAHHSGQRIARDASPDDRLLAVYRLGDGRRLRLASATARHVLTGPWRTLDEEAFLTTQHVRIATDPPLPVDVDGEIRGRTPVEIRLLGNALRVIVPQSFIDT